MIVSIPTQLTETKCSEKEPARTLYDLIQPDESSLPISKGMMLIDNKQENVYEYTLKQTIYPKEYNELDPNAHREGDVVVKNNRHYLVIHVNVNAGDKYPKEPEDYTMIETNLSDFENWTGSYFKLLSSSVKVWTVGDRKYYFYSGKGEHCIGNAWKAWDRTTNGSDAWIYSCIQENHSFKYDAAKDVKAKIVNWGGGNSHKEPTLVMKSVVDRGDAWYFRTWCNNTIETGTVAANYVLREIKSPAEINGFRYKRKAYCFAAFDNKNYTKGRFYPSSGYVDFSFVTASYCDTFVMAGMEGKTVSLTIRDENNKVIFSVTDYPIDNRVANLYLWQPITTIIYAPHRLKPNMKVTIRIKGGWVRIGRIEIGQKLNLGFTNTIFDNSFRDFSPKEQDQWGNIDYRVGVKVRVHSGSVDLPLHDYDTLYRALMFIGGREIIINSSDSINNTPPNSLTIFQSTMMIGRFTSFKQQTKNVGDIMDTVAGFTFAIEESV